MCPSLGIDLYKSRSVPASADVRKLLLVHFLVMICPSTLTSYNNIDINLYQEILERKACGMTIRVLLRDHPHRAVALATDDHILTFRHSPSTAGASSLSVNSNQSATLQPRCMVEFARTADTDTTDFRSLTSLSVFGTLGLITINGDIFLCVVNGAQRAATVRNGENVLKITSVEFREFRDGGS